MLKPELYNHVVAACCKIICSFDAELRIFKASSLALHMGTNLKFMCDVAKKALITKDPLFDYLERESTLRNISEFKEIVASHCCNDISSLASKILNENKWERPKLLPLTEDVLAFNKYVINLANEAFQKLKQGLDISDNYKILYCCFWERKQTSTNLVYQKDATIFGNASANSKNYGNCSNFQYIHFCQSRVQRSVDEWSIHNKKVCF